MRSPRRSGARTSGLAALSLAIAACALQTPRPTPTPTLPPPAIVWASPTASPATLTPTVAPSATAPPPSPPAPTATDEIAPTAGNPLACVQPPDDYSRVVVRGETINARTYAMLQAAQQIYGGPGDLLRVTQGSYRTDVDSSFGTHSGGGVVDISIRNPENTNEFLYDEIEAMVRALRLAGFAAWYRAPGALGEGSPPHIHAVAVGDRELSPEALDQVAGPGGYFAGMDGLPPPHGPNPDAHGGPIVCGWMKALGF